MFKICHGYLPMTAVAFFHRIKSLAFSLQSPIGLPERYVNGGEHGRLHPDWEIRRIGNRRGRVEKETAASGNPRS